MRALLIPVVALLLVPAGCGDSSTEPVEADAASADNTSRNAPAETGSAATDSATTPTTAPATQPAASGDTNASADVDNRPRARPSLSIRDVGASGPPMTRRSVDLFDDYVTVEMPAALMPMNEQQLAVKYPGESRPDIAYTDSSTRVNFTATYTDMFRSPGQLYEYRGLFEKDMRRMYPNMELISNTDVTVDGGPAFLFESYNDLEDARVYNMVLGTSYENKLMLLTCTFPATMEDIWEPVARTMLMTADFHRSGADGQPTDAEMEAMRADDDAQGGSDAASSEDQTTDDE